MTTSDDTNESGGTEDLLEGINFGGPSDDSDSDSDAQNGNSPNTDLSAPDQTGQSARRPGSTTIKSKSIDRSLVRRTATKAVEIASAPEAQRRLLAGLLRCADEVTALTVEVMCAPRGATSTITDLEEVAACDPMEAGVTVASWERARSGALWSLLAQIGSVKGNRPPQDAKAALAIARAALGLSAADKKLLASIVDLARKS